MNIQDIYEQLQKKVKANGPELLIGMGIAGMFSTTVLAVKATPKALELIEDEEDRLNKDLNKREKIKVAWKPYLPAAISFGLSTACLISANNLNARRNTALATACAISEKAFRDYSAKVVEVIGEEKEEEIRDKVSSDILNKTGLDYNQAMVVAVGKGDTLCYDTISGRYFKADMEEIKQSINKLNYEILQHNYISLNDVYEELGLPKTDSGEILGWGIDEGLIEIYFSAQIDDNGKPCLVLNFVTNPYSGFDDVH